MRTSGTVYRASGYACSRRRPAHFRQAAHVNSALGLTLVLDIEGSFPRGSTLVWTQTTIRTVHNDLQLGKR